MSKAFDLRRHADFGGFMVCSRALGYAATVAALAIASPSTAQTRTECVTSGTTTRCETTPPPEQLDYGKALQQGRDLVPTLPRQALPGKIEQPRTKEDGELVARSDYFLTGKGLLQSCEGQMMSREWMACASMVYGVASAVNGIASVNGGRQMACYPKGVTLLDNIKLVRAALKSSPETGNEDAPALVAVTLIRAYPCANTVSQK